MYSGGTRNQPKDGTFLKESAQPGGWQSPTVVGGGGFQAGGWNNTTAVNSDAGSIDFGLKPTSTAPTAATPKPATAAPAANANGNSYAKLGEALSGSQQYQTRSKNSNPWAMEDAAFNMAGVGDLMGMVGKVRAIGGN